MRKSGYQMVKFLVNFAFCFLKKPLMMMMIISLKIANIFKREERRVGEKYGDEKQCCTTAYCLLAPC